MRKLSEVFRIIKSTLEDDPEIEFVCVAARRAHYECRISKEECEKARGYVRALIAPDHAVTSWLMRQGVDLNPRHWRVIHDYRLRWIDHMIQQLEAEGN